MVFLEILVVAEHLSPEVDAESVRGLRWGLGYLWRPFPFWRRWGRGRIIRLVWGHSDLGCSCFPFWRWRGRRRFRRLFWRLRGNRYPSNVSPFGGRRGLNGCLDGCPDCFFLAFPYALARGLRVPRFPPGVRLPFSPTLWRLNWRLDWFDLCHLIF